MKKRKIFALAMSALMMSSTVAPAFAQEYNYSTGASQVFYQSTSTSADAIANSSKIVVGSDGSIAANTSGDCAKTPVSSLQLPAGEYPDSWGKETDIAIAQNSIFPNVLAPTTQMTNVNAPVQYDTGRINSSAIPTPNQMSYYTGGTTQGATTTYQNGAYAMGVTTKEAPMQAIKTDGSIAHLDIPSVGISEDIYESTSDEAMKKGLGHFDATSGWEGNIGLAGHNRGTYGRMYKLENLKVGDTMTYTTSYGTKTYRVVSISTCSTTDTTGLLQDGTNKITLYTCVKNNPSVKRMVVAQQV